MNGTDHFLVEGSPSSILASFLHGTSISLVVKSLELKGS